MMNEENYKYLIIEECRYGPEEFFVLVSSIDFEDPVLLFKFVNTLVQLVQTGFLICSHGNQSKVSITFDEIQNYIEKRRKNGEQLDEHPEICEEYDFTTSEKGLQILQEKDASERKRKPGEIE